MVKLLLAAYTGLGNFVLKTPMIAALREQYPQATLDLIAGSGFGAELVLGSNSPLINHIHHLPTDATWWQKLWFFIALRKEQYDYLLLPFDTDRRFLRIGARIAGVKHLIRHQLLSGELKTTRINQSITNGTKQYLVPLLPDRHEIDLNFDLLRVLIQAEKYKHGSTSDRAGGFTFDDNPVWNDQQTFVFYQPDISILTRYHLAPRRYIVIQPGAANGLHAAKVWSPDKFRALIPLLLAQFQLPIVLVGDAGDNHAFAAPIAVAFNDETRVQNTAGATTFNELVNLLANAAVVICHDSGVMHLADALATPLLALYGPTDYGRTHPRRATSHTLLSDTVYKGSMRYFATDEATLTAQGIGHIAMDGITVAMVMNKLSEIAF